MKNLDQVLQDIKEVKIQGATNVAKAGVKAFLTKPDKKTAKRILKSRPTEPLLQNAIKLLLKSKNPKKDSDKFFLYTKKSGKKITVNGSKLIKNNMNVFTHCHSSTVISILKRAKKQGKKFVVYTTEVEPLLQGRITAKELAKAGIKVIVFPDLAVQQALKNCDLVLFGADAFLPRYIVNKIGTSTICDLAKHLNIPRYACGVSLKFAKKIKIEFRSQSEVWKDNNSKIDIINPAFDKVPKKLITGVISELGILPYKQFAKKAKQNLKKFLA